MEKATIIEKQLKAIYALQLIDSRLDKLRNIRGELPMEVHDLEDEIIGLETRIENIGMAIQEIKDNIEIQKTKISEANALMLKYESQQMHVKNNREFLAITKEMELQKLEVMAAEKKIKELKNEIAAKESLHEISRNDLVEKRKDLIEKERELTDIIGETEKEEADILKEREVAEKNIEDRLIKAYSKIRHTYMNNLAVVPIERDACGGCFSQVPPQRQLDVRLHLKIIACENCGRILVDPGLADEIRDEMNVS